MTITLTKPSSFNALLDYTPNNDDFGREIRQLLR